MTDNYANIVEDNIARLFGRPTDDLDICLGAKKEEDQYLFRAFGMDCRLGPEGVYLDNQKCSDVLAILISLYALNANPAVFIEEPFKAYKEFPNSMPFAGAFKTHTEQILVSRVPRIKRYREEIVNRIDGKPPSADVPGDFTMQLFPLPKISLCYIFYEADEDFPAAATCLYSNNASLFMPIDGLADVGEYTSKKILEIIEDPR